jgi:hypothetical protein
LPFDDFAHPFTPISALTTRAPSTIAFILPKAESRGAAG